MVRRESPTKETVSSTDTTVAVMLSSSAATLIMASVCSTSSMAAAGGRSLLARRKRPVPPPAFLPRRGAATYLEKSAGLGIAGGARGRRGREHAAAIIPSLAPAEGKGMEMNGRNERGNGWANPARDGPVPGSMDGPRPAVSPSGRENSREIDPHREDGNR